MNVLLLEEIDRGASAAVGGKGANLGELSRLEEVRVPPGFCVTTRAFQRVMAESRALDVRLHRLATLKPDDPEGVRQLSAELRATIEALALPEDVAAEIARAHSRLGRDAPYAVRSSATSEDSPTASFAGQQDTYLNVTGLGAILRHVSRCWASLFTERAVTYRLRSGFDHRKVQMAVVIQRMVFPQAAGVLFTADPVSGNRRVLSVEASFGLGEALVSGLVNADKYRVRDGAIIDRSVGSKRLAIAPAPEGGTRQEAVAPELQARPALADADILRLAELGRRIEAHFGAPQDIEWCLADGALHIVQSRPITTLFPVPAAADRTNRVYVSVGHQQMMTDPMTPLGISVWQLTSQRRMAEAGGRLFVDLTPMLATSAGRDAVLNGLGKSDPLIGDAVRTVLDRGDFLPKVQERAPVSLPSAAPGSGNALPTDPALVEGLVARGEAGLAAAKKTIATTSGTALLDFILSDVQDLKRFLFDATSLQVIVAGMDAANWLNERLDAWLGVQKAADTLAQSVPGNVTSEMGLALLDVADVIRPHPEVVALLERAHDDGFLEELPKVSGGARARDAILAWLDKFGMRGVGEIDLTRPRFLERPTLLLPILLSNVRNFAPGAGARRFEQGRQRALALEQELLPRLRSLPDGAAKAEETKRMIDRVRTFAGYREYPKYTWVRREFLYKQALMREAEQLVQAGVLREKEDLFFLRFEELAAVFRTRQVDERLLRERKEAFRAYQALKPPRVLTSEGESITGAYRREHLPAGALVGMPVSAGIVEGRARVILNVADANIDPGDILITAFTDPSWTPVFVALTALVTEVGGLMTHGAVIAREYGLPAVVGVEDATKRIKDGQRIRVNGTNGYVEVLSGAQG